MVLLIPIPLQFHLYLGFTFLDGALSSVIESDYLIIKYGLGHFYNLLISESSSF